jgi:hypothetical protein
MTGGKSALHPLKQSVSHTLLTKEGDDVTGSNR